MSGDFDVQLQQKENEEKKESEKVMKKSLIRPGIIFFIFISIFFLINIQSTFAYKYELPVYVTNNTASPNSVYGLSLKSDVSCTNTLKQYLTSTGTGYNILTSFYSPGGTFLVKSFLEDKDNLSCKYLGQISTSNSINNIFDGRYSLTTTASIINSTLTNDYVCDTTNNWITFNVIPSSDEDSYGNVPNRYYNYLISGGDINRIMNATNPNFNNCYSTLKPTPYATNSGGCTGSACQTDAVSVFYYPFNSSQGIVNYSIAKYNGSDYILSWTENCAGGNSAMNATLYLVDVADGTYSILSNNYVNVDNSYNFGGPGNFWSGQLNLEKNKIYMLLLSMYYTDVAHPGACTSSGTILEPEFNISVFIYTANFVCTEWSDCEDSLESRTCYDPEGIAPSEIEYKTCDITVLENATLGFEEYTTDDDVYICLPQWLPIWGCQYYIDTKSRDIPIGWTIGEASYFKRDFLKMTSEWSTEGSRSLKMWYIPPKLGEPLDNETCGNVSYGTVPVIQNVVNNGTFSIDYDVTFPAENMRLSFDVRGCNSQVKQHDGIKIAWYENVSLFTFCDEQCYASSCDTQPETAYQFIIRNGTGTGSVLHNYYGNARVSQYDTIELDLSNLGLVAGQNYTLQFQISPDNVNSQTGDCVMFDNVRYDILETPFGDCNIGYFCVGNDLYETHLYSNGACAVVKTENSDACVSGPNKDKIFNKEDYCDEDSKTLWHFNYIKGGWESTICSYICYIDECMTESEYQNATYDGTTPAPETVDEWALFLVSGVFVFSFALLILTTLITVKSPDAWPSFIFGLAQFIFILSINNILPIYFAVAEIVLGAMVIAFFITKPMRKS